MSETKSIKIKYFASLREQRGCSEESIQTQAKTYEDLFLELKTLHNFTIQKGHIKVAVNASYANLDDFLKDGDQITFIPPVAGG